MKIYKSKIGLELAIPILTIMGGSLYIGIIEKKWIPVIIELLVIMFISHLFLTTKYIIDKKKLNIKCGFLINQNIDIESIIKISETYNPLSSPATSIDRLELVFNKFDSVLISPKDKKNFIADLIEINPEIEVKYRNR
jgi:hypothetical protein